MEKPSNFITEIIDEDLARGAVKEIHTRFPPEPNGYLHIGSVKAIWINWGIAQAYGGVFYGSDYLTSVMNMPKSSSWRARHTWMI